MTRYVPDGDEPYVLRQRWWHVLLVLPVLLLCAAMGWFGIVMQLGFVTLLAALGCLFALGEGIHQAAAGDRSGIEFAIDERGIYFGDAPYERVPWPQISEVCLIWVRHDPAETDSDQSTSYESQVRIVIAAPTDLPTSSAPSQVRNAVSIEPRWDLKWEAIQRALSQHAPPHVGIRTFRKP